MDTTESSLEERIVCLERRNRRMQNGMFFLGLLALIPWTFAAFNDQTAGPVRATELQMESAGSVVVSLKPTEGGIGVFDSKGMKLVSFSGSSVGGKVSVFNSTGKMVADLDVTDANAGRLIIKDASDDGGAVVRGTAASGGEAGIVSPAFKVAIRLGVRKSDGGGELSVRNGAGTEVVSVSSNEFSGGTVNVASETRVRVAGLGAGENGGWLGIMNSRGKSTVDVWADQWLRPRMEMHGGDGHLLAEVGANANGGTMAVRNLEGRTVAAMEVWRDSTGVIGINDPVSQHPQVLIAGSNVNGGEVKVFNGMTLLGSLPDTNR